MAPIKVLTPTLFLLALIIFSHAIISSEGVRSLSNVNKYSGGEIEHNSASFFEKLPAASEKAGVLGVDGARRALGRSAAAAAAAATADDDEAEAAAVAIKSTDEYRPTEPGHSPGAGHSHGPSSVDPNQ